MHWPIGLLNALLRKVSQVASLVTTLTSVHMNKQALLKNQYGCRKNYPDVEQAETF